MDNIRAPGPFGNELNINNLDDSEYVSYDDPEYEGLEDVEMDAPPSIQGDERRLQVRAYNFWTEQLNDNNYPNIEDLQPEDNEDFAPYGVLLDFTSGIENPSIAYVGEAIRKECDLDENVAYLDQVPARSLLSRITDHYLQIIANRAPIGFEAEFVNERNINIMYRGILLPYSTDDDTIDFIYGLINWKEGADPSLTEELELQVSNALHDAAPQINTDQIWADGPTAGWLDDMGSDDSSNTEISIDMLSHETEPQLEDSLSDWLQAARSSADNAQHADVRSRETLYKAISRAYDFALIAQQNPQDYEMILEDSGIKVQDRAPMTPIVKLVFGSNYDKTRVTEVASAMSFAKRSNVEMGELSQLITSFDGGLKGMVKAERIAKKIENGDISTDVQLDPYEALREAPTRHLSDFDGEGNEFIVLVARRDENGEVELIGNVKAGKAFTEKALRNTII